MSGFSISLPPIRQQLSPTELPLTRYTNREASKLLIEVAKDRKLLIDLYTDKQASSGFTGLDKAKMEAHKAISIVESQLKYLDKAECLRSNEKISQDNPLCTSEMDRTTLIHIAEQELICLQKLPSKQKSMEILYRSMKIINCLQALDNKNTSLDHRIPLMLADAFRLVGQSYNEVNLFDQSLGNYKQAYEILLPLKDQSCLYRATYDIARSLILTHKYSEAMEKFVEMLNKSTSDNERAFVYQYLSFCALNLNDYDDAKKHAYEALDYASASHEELLRIEANILLGKIYFQLKDFPRAEEYLIYAQSLKDQLGDLNQMKYLDELLSVIKNHKKNIFLSQTSSFGQLNDSLEERSERNLYNYRILTPYHRLFYMCREQKKKAQKRTENFKKTLPVPRASLPLLSTTNSMT
ncbi:unnamed protein product [Adineta ricciae]|uniref:Tetratricopeptide repeat protein n=1 Tax=Adineta ricciae TaxID=249248 RepID=A0A813Y3Q6_ADIRI|nr:unnamed protein product [Adineta ricciae]CAF1071385.1 unnamed protein product [Adineta ricciae]